ncbi:MAG: hypothetical protein AAGA77_16945 [Bacteroidota bacterium]
MRILTVAICFIAICFATGCKPKPLIAKKIEIGGTWSYANELSFPLEIDRLDDTYDLMLSLTYGTDFSYQNIYVKIITEYPNGKKDEDILSLNLTNGQGLFLGDCGSTKCKIDLLLQERFKFSEAGKYSITIIQNGREEQLDNIYAAELKLYNLQ